MDRYSKLLAMLVTAHLLLMLVGAIIMPSPPLLGMWMFGTLLLYFFCHMALVTAELNDELTE
jgi:hypothetical protein